MNARLYSIFRVTLVALVAAMITGCATTESENVSSRPWNTPQGWTGLPSGINEGR